MLGPMDWLNFGIALVALAVSTALAVLRFIEWQAKPEWDVDVDWLGAEAEPVSLHIVVGNHGRARGGIRAVLLSPTEDHDPQTAFAHLPMQAQLPVMVEPGDLAPFTFTAERRATTTLSRSLIDGQFHYVIIIDERRKAHAFPISDRPPDSGTRRNRYGRVAKR